MINTVAESKAIFPKFHYFSIFFLIFSLCNKCYNSHAKSYVISDENFWVRFPGKYITRIA